MTYSKKPSFCGQCGKKLLIKDNGKVYHPDKGFENKHDWRRKCSDRSSVVWSPESLSVEAAMPDSV